MLNYMELVYLYIPEYKSILDQEYNFSNRHHFSRTIKSKGEISFMLDESINDAEQWQNDFFGDKISNLTVIVGANGTGKSTLLEFINNELSINGNHFGANFFAIFEDSGSFCVKFVDTDSTYNIEFEFEKEIEGIGMIHFYPISDLTFSQEYLSNAVGNGRINVSDNALFFADYEREMKLSRSTIFQQTFQKAISSYAISNVDRELEFFNSGNIGEVEPADVLVIKTIDIVDYLESEIKTYQEIINKWEKNESLLKAYKTSLDNVLFLRGLVNNDRVEIISEEYKFARALSIMLFVNIQTQLDRAFTQINEDISEVIHESTSHAMANAIKELKLKQDKRQLILEDYLTILLRIHDTEEANLNISKNAHAIYNLLKNHIRPTFLRPPSGRAARAIYDIQTLGPSENFGTVFVYFKEHFEKTRELVSELRKITFISRVFSYEWRSELNQPYNYSTGESQIIKLFSRLNYGLNHMHSNSVNSCTIFLDEAELSMHPEWQKKFIKWLVNYINSDKRIEFKVQLILTTHSPLMLSDVPSKNVIRLNKDNIEYGGVNSFGANLFDLLKDSFFLKDGFLGEFAKEKLESAIDYIHAGNSENEFWTPKKLMSFISIIGEPLIREEMRSLFFEKFQDYLTNDDLDEEIKRLQNLKN